MTTKLILEQEVSEGTLEYPFLLIDGLKYKIEIDYFKDTLSGNMPLYIKLADEFVHLGTANLDHSLFITLKLISNGSYHLYLYKSKDAFTEIDYMDAKVAENALRVRW